MRFDRDRLDALVRGPRPVRRGLVLLVSAVALVVISGVASIWRLGYVVPQDLFQHPVRHPLIASVLLIWALHLLVRSGTLRALAIMAAVSLACFWYVGLSSLAANRDAPETVRPTPSARYEAHVEQLILSFEPTWRLVIRERRGWLSREWDVGCFTSRYQEMRWIRPGLLDLGNGSAVETDPVTGRPRPGQDLSSACS